MVIALYLAPTVSNLLQLALSRAREYDADLDAAQLTGDPAGLASALDKLERYQGRFWEDLLLPGRRIPDPSLLRSHPPTEERVRRLLALRPAAPLPEAVRTLRLAMPPHFQVVRRRPRLHWTGLWH